MLLARAVRLGPSHVARCALRVMGGLHGESAEERMERKAAVKAAKAAKRLQKAGLGDPAVGRKPCTLCQRPRDLLIRCQVDESGRWHMACGRCWVQHSGGKVDGDTSHPHYRYGGLWKNHKAQVSGKHKVPRTSPGADGRPTTASGPDSSSSGSDDEHSANPEQQAASSKRVTQPRETGQDLLAELLADAADEYD